MCTSEPIEWIDALLTGVSEIDQQHRILVDTLIEARTMLSGEADGSQFERVSRDLLAYAIYHFDKEEQLMRDHGYAVAVPEAAAQHLAQHRHFSERVVALRTAEHLGEPGAGPALLAFLEAWLVNHILNTDKALGLFICATAPGPATPGVDRQHPT
jgi:hemerythrin-like metal-binding protein